MRRIFFIVIGILPVLQSIAQEISREQWLDEVEVVGLPPEKYAVGSKIETIDSVATASLITNNLGGLLMQHASLYIKEYGGGMLSSVSLRGTSASHTAVLWNGLNLNSLTLGSTDFSNLPVFMFDEVSIHYGGGSALYGSDAIGGSVVLHSQPQWIEGYRLQLAQSMGSFGQNFSGLKTTFGHGKWEGKTTFYYYQSDNDFPFENTAKYGQPEERQQNASVRNVGLMQEAGYHFSANRYLYLHMWYEDSDNDILPLMGNNLKPEAYEHIRDRHLRTALEYHQLVWGGHLSLMAGYINDHQIYHKQAPIATSRLVTQASYEKVLAKKFTLKAGGEFQHIRPEVVHYASGISQQRYDLFALLRYTPYDFWQLSLKVRQAFVTGFQAPLAPALGSALILFQQKERQLVLKNQLSRSYRIPTFNDLYWEPGGNPDLKPEIGWSTEGGLQYTQQLGKFTLSTEATYYRMWLDNWIIWMDGGTFWSPENIRKVHVQGAEFNSQLAWTGTQQRLSLKANYAFTSSKNKKALSIYDRSFNKQLPYTPIHRAVINLQYERKAWFANANFSLTSKRYLTTTNESYLEGFALVNTDLGRDLSLWKATGTISLRISNLLNTRYQNVNNRAMPGVHYQLNLKVYFSNKP